MRHFSILAILISLLLGGCTGSLQPQTTLPSLSANQAQHTRPYVYLPSANLSDAYACNGALNAAKADWDTNPSFALYVAEAKRRGLTSERCVAIITGSLAPPPATRSSIPQATIPLQKHGGVLTVPVQINGMITLNFLIDSGASDVVLPADVLLTLTRTGTVGETDFRGTAKYKLANGSTATSQLLALHSVKVGNFVVNDVAASVAPVRGDPLLGQSFLARLPAWAIDNTHQVLVIGP